MPEMSPTQNTIALPPMTSPCRHHRIIDDVRDAQGQPTGTLVCLECGAQFPDPDTSRPRLAR